MARVTACSYALLRSSLGYYERPPTRKGQLSTMVPNTHTLLKTEHRAEPRDGLTDITIIRAEGLGLGPEQREAAMRAALASPMSGSRREKLPMS